MGHTTPPSDDTASSLPLAHLPTLAPTRTSAAHPNPRIGTGPQAVIPRYKRPALDRCVDARDESSQATASWCHAAVSIQLLPLQDVPPLRLSHHPADAAPASGNLALMPLPDEALLDEDEARRGGAARRRGAQRLAGPGTITTTHKIKEKLSICQSYLCLDLVKPTTELAIGW